MRIISNIINIFNRNIQFGEVFIENGLIHKIEISSENPDPSFPYLLPGFVDAHVHIESSMLTPIQFARLAVVHGTVATVSDPHEIGNVLGVKGVEYMLENAEKTSFKFCFGAPSCVPATVFETAGAVISPEDVEYLFKNYPKTGYLAEVMNFPGVLMGDPDMLSKIAIAQKYSKPVDGHAPGLRGEEARRYIEAGCQTDHECFTAEEALDKLKYGMKILIREGSAAKNFEALINLLPGHFEQMMFCSDDKHPDNLVEGHINQLVKRALAKGFDLFQVLQMACVNPVQHYKLPVGLLRPDDPADFILIDNPENFNILKTFLNGELVSENGISKIPDLPSEIVNNFNCNLKSPEDFICKTEGVNADANIKVIEVLDGQLITLASEWPALVRNGALVSDTENDLLKIAVVNRYADSPPAIAFIKNFGLKTGAIASSVAHDSHNIIAVGIDDVSISKAVNAIIEVKGGVSAVNDQALKVLPLPIAGLMSGEDGYEVAGNYAAIDHFSKRELGCTLNSPFMSLSFMALLVIPNLKLSDLGLFDGQKFQFTKLLV